MDIVIKNELKTVAIAYELNILGHKGKKTNWAKMPWNQLAGMDLCKKAAFMFDEHYRGEPWN